MTEAKHRLITCDEVTNKSDDNQSNSAGFPKIRNDLSRLGPQPEKDVSKEVEDFCNQNKEMISAVRNCEVENKKKGRLLSPILSAISNFNLAKKLHRENLEHNPLPDTVTDRLFKKIQMQRQQEPGLSLEDKHSATGKVLVCTFINANWLSTEMYGNIYWFKPCRFRLVDRIEILLMYDYV